ncbi:19076_t:CDS:2 [Gigaspora rosea]|nr:19076_t:CDS:2 [Gigaspora rosea]
MAGYFDETSHKDWSLDGLAKWCAINISCDKKKLLDSMKKDIQDVNNSPISEAARLKDNSMQAKLEETHYRTVSRLGVELLSWKLTKSKSNYFKYLQDLREIKDKEAIRLAQIKRDETVKLAEIKSKFLQEHIVIVANFLKNIANDLTTVDRK